MSTAFSGGQIDATGFVIIGFALAVAAVSIPSISFWLVDSWRELKREREFQRLLSLTLGDLRQHPTSRLEAEPEELVEEIEPLNALIIKALLGDVDARNLEQPPNATNTGIPVKP